MHYSSARSATALWPARLPTDNGWCRRKYFHVAIAPGSKEAKV
jgi:hypothetical protein